MNILSFECSSPQASMAVCVEGQNLAEVSWDTGQRRAHRLFEELDLLFEQVDIPLQKMDAFAVGRGPGNFTGMRISLATAQAMALPENKPCLSLSSGTCLAAAWFEEHEGPLAVVGDARRGQCWMGLFDAPPKVGEEASWFLCPYEDFLGRIPEGSTLISSEMSRVEEAIPRLHEGGFIVDSSRHIPSAGVLGKRAFACLESKLLGESLEPLYMHPAV